MLALAMVIFPAPAINTLITDLDEPNPASAPFPACENTVCERVMRD
jgi:hypothetical protein